MMKKFAALLSASLMMAAPMSAAGHRPPPPKLWEGQARASVANYLKPDWRSRVFYCERIKRNRIDCLADQYIVTGESALEQVVVIYRQRIAVRRRPGHALQCALDGLYWEPCYRS